MAVYDTSLKSTCLRADTTETIYYDSHAFGSPLPTTAASFSTYNGPEIAYFLEITCLGTGESLFVGHPEVSVYPNPASDVILVSGRREPTKYLIRDIHRKVLKNNIIDQSAAIVTRELERGVYLLELGSANNVMFVKN